MQKSTYVVSAGSLMAAEVLLCPMGAIILPVERKVLILQRILDYEHAQSSGSET